jgi:NAD(P)-dependent dehydrogenase (short-subunit alcohol dehydrogenase family)
MGRTAVVTGAARGIGYAIAVALAEEGFDIAAIDLPGNLAGEELRRAVAEKGRRFAAYDLDIAQLDAHADVVAAIIAEFGQIDCLVNNAGVSVLRRGDLLTLSVESFDRCFNVNTRGTFFFTQEVARRMASAASVDGEYRSIIFVTSSNAVAASVERGEYCMSKTALSMACKLFAIRLAQHDVAVFEVQPGLILTEMTAPSKAKYDALIAQGMTIDQRWGLPEDVARTVRTMAAGLLPYTVAQEVRIDGGMMLTRF